MPPAAGGLARIDTALRRLTRHERVLVLGAHPDDEDTAILALVAAEGGEAAYLSLSRGEGGQNLIGGELGAGLGILRTQELLAARRRDGARQFFTRAYDFGWSPTLADAAARWPEEELLRDAVRVVRRFAPQVLVAVFPEDPRAGHGQHQVSARIARLAFEAAGDPARFPELAAEGLAPWQPTTFLRGTYTDPEAATLVVSVDALDPLTGRSVYQTAMASRSQHRSQDMGMLEEPGHRERKLAWLAGGAGADAATLLAGVDTRLAALALHLPEGEGRDELWRELDAVATASTTLRQRLGPASTGEAVPELASILRRLRIARALATDAGPAGARVGTLLDEKIGWAEAALAAAAGVVVEALVDRDPLVPGGNAEVTLRLWNASDAPVEIAAIGLAGRSIVSQQPATAASPQAAVPGTVAAHGEATWTRTAGIAADAPTTEPYALARAANGNAAIELYDWSAVPAVDRGAPMATPPLVARFTLAIAGEPVVVERAVAYRERDQAIGEVRRLARVAPAIEVAATPPVVIWRRGAPPPSLAVALHSHRDGAVAGVLEARPTATAESASASSRREISVEPGEDGVVTLPLAVDGLAVGRHPLAVTFRAGDATFDAAAPLVDYPHVAATPWPRSAAAALAVVDAALPNVGRVGYVRGAADGVPEVLTQLGVPVDVLDVAALEGDLAAYRVLVLGPRAYEHEPRLARVTPHLAAWARAGGTLIVQYQQYVWTEGGHTILPLTIARPHGRVADETAAVTILASEHAALRHPNPIGPADWDGWIQERGLYFGATWDPAWTPLLETADPADRRSAGACWSRRSARVGSSTPGSRSSVSCRRVFPERSGSS